MPAAENSYFESTWIASCLTSVVGAIYTAAVAVSLTRGEITLGGFFAVFVIALILSLPVFIVGSGLIGSWLTGYLSTRVKTRRAAVFGMAGIFLGILVDAIGLVILSAYFKRPLWPDMLSAGPAEWINWGMIASVPIFFVTFAGFVAGIHQNYCDREGNSDIPV